MSTQTRLVDYVIGTFHETKHPETAGEAVISLALISMNGLKT